MNTENLIIDFIYKHAEKRIIIEELQLPKSLFLALEPRAESRYNLPWPHILRIIGPFGIVKLIEGERLKILKYKHV